MDVISKVKNWYRGKVIYPENDRSSSVVLISLGYYEQPPLAKALNRFARFWLSNWQWIITTMIALCLHFN